MTLELNRRRFLNSVLASVAATQLPRSASGQSESSAASPGSPHRVGSDAPVILAELGYSEQEVSDLVAAGVVGQTEFLPYT